MSAWRKLLRLPDDPGSTVSVNACFGRIAELLLNGTELVVGAERHRLIEIEFYLRGPGHADPFTHNESIQYQCGRWYFHRSHGTYRGGTFKGFDLTFGNRAYSGGILIRSLVRGDGTVINGSSLCVEHLLKVTGVGSVAALDQLIGDRFIWDSDSPLSLQRIAATSCELLSTPRVGLSLKRAKAVGDWTGYLMRPYRFLSAPAVIRKGKPHMVLALHALGRDENAIRALTGCPSASIRRYVAEFEAGRRDDDFASYFGKDIGPREWCRLFGVWWQTYGPVSMF